MRLYTTSIRANLLLEGWPNKFLSILSQGGPAVCSTPQISLSIWGQLSGTFLKYDNNNPILDYSIACGNSMGKNTAWFIEVYQSIVNNQDPQPISINYGITFLSNPNFQLDLSMGNTFNKTNNKYKESSRFIEWGFSFRLPN